jgi:hypothetical protein
MSTVEIPKIEVGIFVLLDDLPVAKRGKDGTPQANGWEVERSRRCTCRGNTCDVDWGVRCRNGPAEAAS